MSVALVKETRAAFVLRAAGCSTVIRGTGHLMMLEAPQVFAAAVHGIVAAEPRAGS